MNGKHQKSPRHVDEQEYPEPERLVTPAEEAGQDIAELEDPPQAEGARDAVDEPGQEGGEGKGER